MSMKNSNYTIGNRTRDLPACSAVPQLTALPRAPAVQGDKAKSLPVRNLGWMVSFAPKPPYPREENPSICFVAPHPVCLIWRREKSLASAGIRTLDCTVRNVVTVTTELSRLRLRRECKKINISSTLKMATGSVSEPRLSSREDFIEEKYYTNHSLTNWTAFQDMTLFNLVDSYQRHHLCAQIIALGVRVQGL